MSFCWIYNFFKCLTAKLKLVSNGTSPCYLGLAFVCLWLSVCFRKLPFPTVPQDLTSNIQTTHTHIVRESDREIERERERKRKRQTLVLLDSVGGSFWYLPLLSMHNNCYLQQFADVINIYCCFILSACKYEQRQLGLGLRLGTAVAAGGSGAFTLVVAFYS